MSIDKYKAEISKLFRKIYGKDFHELSISEDLLIISHSAGESPTEFLEWFKTVENQWCVSL